jgi:hypothetical protein
MSSKGNGLEVCGKNPYYWQCKGRPVMLSGGSGEENVIAAPFRGSDCGWAAVAKSYD